jgi:hypothetical protein
MAKSKGSEGQAITEAQKVLQAIERAKKVKEEWLKDFRVSLAYEYMEGRQRPSHISAEEWITVNLFYSNLRAILPTLYRQDPYFYIKVRRSFKPHPMDIALFEQKARVRQSMLNYLKGELKIKQKIRLSILDAFFQFGVVKSHINADLMDNPDKDKPVENEYGEPMFDEQQQPLMNPATIPANIQYKVTRVHPKDIFFDEDAGPLEDDWGRIYQRITVPLNEAKQDKRYKDSVRKTLKATENKSDFDKQEDRRKKGLAVQDKDDKQADIVVTYECYDLKNGQWYVVAEGNDDYLIDPAPVPQGIEKHPFSFLVFFPRDNSVYPIPACTQWIDSQREYCELRSKILVHRKRFNRKYEVYAPGVEEEEITKLEIGDDGTIIRKNQPVPVVTPIQDASLDLNHINELQMLRKDFDDVAVGPNQRGSAQGVDSATEAGIIEKRVMIQEGDDISLVAEFVTDIGRKVDQLVQENITEDQAVQVAGPDGKPVWELIRATAYEKIQGEYEYSVNAGTMAAQLPEVERAQWNAFLANIGANWWLALNLPLLTYTAKLYNIEDENLVTMLHEIAKKMAGGQLPMPGQSGSTPGSVALPISGQGAAFGINNIRGGQQ